MTSHDPQEKQTQINQLNKQIKRLSRRDKNKHIGDICAELQQYADRNEPRELFNTVKYMTRNFKARTQNIRDSQGRIVTNLEEIIKI